MIIKLVTRKILPLLVFLSITQMSCLEDPPMLNKEDYKQIDSLYIAERKILLSELDSICEANFDSRVKIAVDSLMERRLKEIDRLKNRE